ncbi:MAG TPA: TetR/AcrR family transcriptional regulator [Solirubrobacterales bacterium]|jgi:AcrR family transcriptional regulator|nr:TetR/AcrR family transcriptional regulator [Solirubrobacterales bacterium]
MHSDATAELDSTLIWLREEPCPRKPGNSRAGIAAAAIEIADTEGLEAVSMRRVAQQLGAGTMTLYHYVANKDELLTLMMDAVMGEVLVPADQLPREWRPAMARIALSTLASLRKHRWTLDLLDEPRPSPNKLRHLEQSLQAIAGAGADPKARLEAIVLIDEYVFGFAIREAQEPDAHGPVWPPGVREFFQRELDSGQFPHARELLGEDLDAGVAVVREVFREEGRFERGLERLLDGIEAGFAKPA